MAIAASVSTEPLSILASSRTRSPSDNRRIDETVLEESGSVSFETR